MGKPKEGTEMDDNSIVLAPEGDVILVVGEKQLRIYADSLFLKRHSTVFAALLGPNFSEGQDLNTSSPKEIPLPDDDPYAMTAICATIYHNFDLIPRSPTTGMVLSIIRHADKYDCFDVLTLPSQGYGWLKCDHLTIGKDLVNILAVSYLIRDREAFQNASKALLLKYGESFADLADDVICDVLPWKTFCRLEELRTRIQALALSIAQVAVPTSYSSRHGQCSKLAREIQAILCLDLSVELHDKQPDRWGALRPHAPTPRQSIIGPLLEKLKELAKACDNCNKNVKDAQLDMFGLSLGGKDLRTIVMLPERYWARHWTY